MSLERTKTINVAGTTHSLRAWHCASCRRLIGWYSPDSRGIQATQCRGQHCKADNVVIDGVPHNANAMLVVSK